MKDLLQAMAAQGADSVELDEDRLVPRIRRRRRRRSVVIGVAGLAAAAVVAVSASAVLPDTAPGPAIGPATGPATSVASPGRPVVTTFPNLPRACGPAFPTPASVGTKIMKLTQQATAESPGGWSAIVLAQVTNIFDKPLVSGAPRALAVVQDNRMVGHATPTVIPKPVEIPPGQTHTFTLTLDIRSCDGARLPVGAYLLYEYVTDAGKSVDAGPVPHVPLGRIQLT